MNSGSVQSKQTRVSFEQTNESKERYECTFAAYLEVRTHKESFD